MISLRIDDLAEMLGKTRKEVEELLNSQEVIELRLSERKPDRKGINDELRINEI